MDRIADKAVRERGILFRAEMVRAILDGRKTQTRRVVKNEWQMLPLQIAEYQRDALEKCPYGKPGDRLWVRETWRSHLCFGEKEQVYYRADGEVNSCDRCGETLRKWTPAIHMFRRASRITLQILKVRAERVQDISPDDVKAEGVLATPFERSPKSCWVAAFEDLWDLMRQGTGFAWEKNPWVWVIEFRRIS